MSQVGSSPERIAITLDGGTVHVGIFYGATIVSIDAATATRTKLRGGANTYTLPRAVALR